MENIIDLALVIFFGLVGVFLVNYFFKKINKVTNRLPLKFLESILTFVIIVITVYAALNIFDVTKNLSTLLIRSSTLIIALITFAAQQTLGNVIAGFSLSFSHPIDIGDKVRIVSSGKSVAEGIVKDITIRHVVIEQYDGQTCIVPNSIVDSSVIVNNNYIDRIGNYLEIEVGFDTDLDKAKKIIHDLLAKEETVIRKDVNIMTSHITKNGLLLKFTVWTKTIDENYIVCSRLRGEIVKEFLKEGIHIPYQTVTVHEIKEN